MKSQGLSKQQQHALLSGAVLLVLLVLFFAVFFVPAIIIRQDLDDRIAELELQLNKFRLAGQKLEQLEKEIEQLNKTHANTGEFLAEKSPALAAADLQQFIKGIIESNQANIVSSQPVNEESGDIFPKVTIKIHMRGNINALQQTLYKLESSKPRLFINNIIIQKRNPIAARNNLKDAEQLEVRFDIYGYVFNSSI